MLLDATVDNAQISAHTSSMRRKAGTLIPIEQSILAAALMLLTAGEEEFHGYQMAKEIKGQTDARLLTGHGTLYRALERLEQAGFLGSRWEDPMVAAQDGRPRRKLYKLTAAGATAGKTAAAEAPCSDKSDLMKPVWGT